MIRRLWGLAVRVPAGTVMRRRDVQSESGCIGLWSISFGEPEGTWEHERCSYTAVMSWS